MKWYRKFLNFICCLSCCKLPVEEDDEVEYEICDEKENSEPVTVREKYASCPNLMMAENKPGILKKWRSQNFAHRKKMREKRRWKAIPNRRPTRFIDKYKSRKEGTSQELETYLDYLATFCRPVTGDNEYTQAFELEWVMGHGKFEWAYRHIYRDTYAEGD